MKDKVFHLLLDLSSVWVEVVLRNRTLNFDVSFDKLFFQSQTTTSKFLLTFAKSTFCVQDSFQVLFDSINGTQVCIVFFPFCSHTNEWISFVILLAVRDLFPHFPK